MSSALAIASVTAVLKDLLENALTNDGISSTVGDPVTVTARAPDRIKTGQEESAQLNLFLYHVAPNPGWRNVGLPSRDGRGQRLTNAPLPLDLYYLLTAYGKNDFDVEAVLGYAMQTLHETPVLTRDAIRNVATAPASDLADQVELVKLSPQPLSTEELSKLWSAFQANYRPSAAYHASVVLIESERPVHSPLPVLTRGRRDPVSGRDEGVIVQPNLLPPFPTLQEANPPKNQPAVRMGEVLSLRGHHLDGQQVTARFTHARSLDVLELAASPTATATEVDVQIPSDPPPGPVPAGSPRNPDNWRAGIYTVAGVIQRPAQADRITNELPIALAPRLSSPSVNPVGDEITVTCSPKVWKAQRVTLVVGDREVLTEPIMVEKTKTLKFKSSDFPKGEQWLRLRVDGVTSILVDRSTAPAQFDPSQKLTIL